MFEACLEALNNCEKKLIPGITVGEVFDPNIHQAVGVVQSDSVPENHIVEECLGGYLLHDRIIRPAMVRVSGKN